MTDAVMTARPLGRHDYRTLALAALGGALEFYDFIIFQDRSWFAWGYGWPKQQSDIENTNFEALALELVESFIKDIYITWNVRADTSLALVLDPKQRAYSYGLPGEETR